MNKLRKRINVMSLVLCALIPLSFSAHKELIVHAEDDFEIWDLKLSGMTEGKCKMFLKRTLIKKDEYKISGRFSGAIEDDQWGTGLLNCNLQGTIRKNNILVEMMCMSEFQDGDASGFAVQAPGEMEGTFSKSQGFGTYSVLHEFGSSSGKWTAVKAGERFKPELHD